MATQAILPSPQEVDSPPKQADLVKSAFFHVTVGPKVAKEPDVAIHMTSADLGSKSQIPQRVVLTRNLFSKIDAGNFYIPYCSVKICPPLSREL